MEALTDRRRPSSIKLMEELHRGAFEDQRLEAFVIDLLGARYIQEAVPILVDFVTSNQMSFLPGKAADALLKIGDVWAIPKIVRQTEWDTYYHLLVIRREIQAGNPFRREFLMAGLIATSIVRGRELPEVEAWRQELLAKQELLEEKCDTESKRVRQRRAAVERNSRSVVR